MEHKLQFDRSFLGQEFPAGTHQLTEEYVTGFCRFIGETNPVYLDEAEARRQGHPRRLAPPIVLFVLDGGSGPPEINLQFKHKRRVLGGITLDLFAPIYVGDNISASSHLKDVYTKTGRSGAMAFVVWDSDLFNQNGVKVASRRNSWVYFE